jgi:hypothetical protein
MLVHFEAGKEEVNAANGYFLNPSLLIVYGDAQGVVD